MSLADKLHTVYVKSGMIPDGLPSEYLTRLKADQEAAQFSRYEKDFRNELTAMLISVERDVFPPPYTIKFPPVDRQVVVSMVEKISNELKDSDDLSLTVTVREDNEYGSLMAIIRLYPVL